MNTQELYTLQPVAVGAEMPDMSVDGLDARIQPLSSFWHQRGCLLILVRHWNCIFCRAQLAELRLSQTKILGLTNLVIVIPHTASYLLPRLTGSFGLNAHILCDPDCRIHRALGYGHMRATEAINYETMISGAQLLLKGYIPWIPDGDVEQLPGVIAISTTGHVLARHQHRFGSDYMDIAQTFSFVDLITASNAAP